jgi:drug/metabolite transporter (DMT)-like permease
VASGVVFLGERLAPTAWLGLACTLAGVIAMTLPARPSRTGAEPRLNRC